MRNPGEGVVGMNLTTDISTGIGVTKHLRAQRAPRDGRVDGSPARPLGRFMNVLDENLKEEGTK
jgi:hypothetical protein